MGSEARSALAAEGIDIAGVVVTDRPTGVALIVVDPRAENLIVVAPGANGEVHARHVTAALGRLAPGPRDVVLVCREIPPDGVRAALEIGREAGAITILNPAPAGPPPTRSASSVSFGVRTSARASVSASRSSAGDDPE